NPGWRLTNAVQWFSNYTDWFIVTNHSTATNVTIEFASVPGYATPPPFHTNIATGFVTNGVYIVVIPANYTLLSSAQLVVTPGGGLVSSGYFGGPFTPSFTTYTLANTGGQPLSWLIGRTTNWFSLSASGGVLAVGATTNITVFLNASANTLPPGTHSG